MSKCNYCPFQYFDYEENCNFCKIEEYLEEKLPRFMFSDKTCSCRVPMFILKLWHKKEMKSLNEYFRSLSKDDVCKGQGW